MSSVRFANCAGNELKLLLSALSCRSVVSSPISLGNDDRPHDETCNIVSFVRLPMLFGKTNASLFSYKLENSYNNDSILYIDVLVVEERDVVASKAVRFRNR